MAVIFQYCVLGFISLELRIIRDITSLITLPFQHRLLAESKANIYLYYHK